MSQRKSKKNRARGGDRSVAKEPARRLAPPVEAAPPAPQRDLRSWVVVLSALLVPLTLWAYWPTFLWMEDQWRNEPDYSHGYLIIPLALLVLYHRRDLFPGVSARLGWAG